MTFARYYNPGAQLVVAGQTWRSIDGDGIAIEWSARRDNTRAPDTATIVIRNPSSKRAPAVVRAWREQRTGGSLSGLNARFSIGWDGDLRLLISADVTNAEFKSMPNGTALVVELGDGERASVNSIVTRQVAGSTASQLLVLLITGAAQVGSSQLYGLGYLLSAKSKATIQASAGAGVTYSGVPVGAKTEDVVSSLLDALGLEGRVHNGEFIVTRGKALNLPAMVFRPSNGVASFATREDGGCDMTALGDPQMQPGLQFRVTTEDGRDRGARFYRCESAEWSGSTFAARSVMRVLGADGGLA